ncbi:terpene synthase family protein [Nostoc sp.]|uniref:terpene synthase family protein n=1 Tax=Nostoc sp. TaxID=1180 RepID=UPI002FF108F4
MTLAFKLPELIYPSFCSDISPYADEIQENTLRWASNYGMMTESLKITPSGLLGARAYPKASKETLQIAADWVTWLFLYDDEIDDANLGQEPDKLYILHSELLSILRGNKPTQEDWAIAHLLANWRDRVSCYVSRDWMERYSSIVALYLEANRWEARNRKLAIVPEVENYIAMRSFSGAVYACFALIELAEGIELPFYILESGVAERLQRLACNIICWSNDMFSFHRERNSNDVNNLVYAVHKHQDIDLQSAVIKVQAMHDKEVNKFEQLLLELPTYKSLQIQDNFLQFVKGIQYWITANRDWSIGSTRYEQFGSAQFLFSETASLK